MALLPNAQGTPGFVPQGQAQGPGGLLGALQSPLGLAGINILANPRQPGRGLLQGFQQAQQFQTGQLQQEAIRQQILKAQQESDLAERRAGQRERFQQGLQDITQTSELAGPRRPEFQGQPLTQPSLLQQDPQRAILSLLGQSATPQDINSITGLLGAVQPEQVSQAPAVKNAIALGLQPGTDEFNQFVREQVLKPVSQVNIGQVKAPSGFMFKDPNDPRSGVVPIPGGPVGRKTPEQAAKVSLLTTAKEILPQVRNALVSEDPETGEKSVDRALVATMSTNAPFTQGRLARTRLLDAVEAKLRAESGAAVPQQEVVRAAQRFIPNPLDSDESVIDKMDRLETFLDTSLKATDPELFESLTKDRVKPEGKVESRRVLNGKNFIKQNGQWFEVQ